MAADGRLGGQALKVGDQEFAVGDRIVALRNQWRLGVLNGTRGTVIGVDLDAGVLDMCTDDGRTMRLPGWYLAGARTRQGLGVDYGYAITGHKVEGMTTDRAFVLGSEDLYKEWGYTAMSRGRLENKLYLVIGENLLAEELDVLGQPKQNPVAVIVRAFGRSRAKRLALDHMGTARGAAAGLPDAELRTRIDQATALLERRPPLTAQTGVTELHQEQARLRGYRRDETSWIVEARQRLAEDRLRRSERRRLQRAIPERVKAVTQLERRLDDVDQRLADLDAERAAQAAWDRDHAESLGEALIYGRELSHRELVMAVQLEQDPPRYLTEELGGRPRTPTGRAAWRAAAVAIEAYRATHGIDDPDSALGFAPDESTAQLERAGLARLTQVAVQAMEGAEGAPLPDPNPDQLRNLAL
jgi:hypothetical protein